MALVRTTDLIYENNVAPSASDNFAAGFKYGDDWRLTTTGVIFTCTGDGVWVNVTDVITGQANFLELNTALPTTTNSSWTVISTGYPNGLLTIIIYNGAVNDRTVGVREVGSVLERSFTKPKETTTTLQVKSDASGNIEIKSDSSAAVTFTLVGDLT